MAETELRAAGYGVVETAGGAMAFGPVFVVSSSLRLRAATL